ncbi:MAG: PD-(D/E)XK nuclease family protein [Chloroflexi bacterium]|nr:PD-(D/E)XK nuclease family protein [Chloroflexota bacterium]
MNNQLERRQPSTIVQQPTWVSNSTIGDYLKCPRTYFLKNVYKNQNGKKIALINPSLTLGQIVHEVLESLTKLKAEERFNISLIDRFEREWSKYRGEMGGFRNQEQKKEYKERGAAMIRRVIEHPGPLLNKTLKLPSPDELPPRYILSKEANILLCGKIDWLEYLPEDDSLHIIDFKTGKNDEDENSLQIPIYCLLAKNLQRRNVKKISYWYVDRENEPREMTLPDFGDAHRRVLSLALKIRNMRQERAYSCSMDGCYACRPLEDILEGKCKFIGTRGYQDIYITQTDEYP